MRTSSATQSRAASLSVSDGRGGMTKESDDSRVDVRRMQNGALRVALTGDWQLEPNMPDPAHLLRQVTSRDRHLEFETIALGRWDSSLLLYLDTVIKVAVRQKLETDLSGLPDGVRRLLHLADSVPARAGTGTGGVDTSEGFVVRLGRNTLDWLSQGRDLLAFVGEVVLSLGRLFAGKARFRRADLVLFLQKTGIEALPIVGLLSLLIGMVLAFVGAVQLALFGAQIYVANLVGVGMVREMGALMTAIIMAGRTGASFAAQLGTMQANEEIDAFRTLGVPAMDFLVLPRLLALTLMMPLLYIYSSLLGILGGAIVSAGLYDIGFPQYLEQVRSAVGFADLSIGLIKGLVFGLLVAAAGCYHGIRCGRSSAAVGEATTRAVVMSIVSIVLADSIAAVVISLLGI